MRSTALRLVRACVVLLAAALAPAAAQAAVMDSNFNETDYVTSTELQAATGMAWAPDGSNRLFIARRDGQIRVIKNGTLLTTPFATLAVYTGGCCGETGLIGLAFDPDFLSNKYVYAFVTVSTTEQQIIRFTATGDTGSDKTILIAGLPTDGHNHNGGALAVGPDGKLYWSIGNNGAAARGHDGAPDELQTLASKVGRANRDGTAPSDNPFADGSGPNNDFIWARGFRNPFTMTFQPTTGLMWLDVVGDTHEQIFIVKAADNGGYNLFEANQPSNRLHPVIKYRTNGSDAFSLAVSGGAVRAGNVVTFTTTAAHLLVVGERVTVAGVGNASFNGTFYVASTPSATTFTVAQNGAGATSGGGTVTTNNIGGCVTGGAFYDATQFGAGYRGNFFYGDYNSKRIVRATIDPATNAVTSNEIWADSLSGQVDISVGPDGALYYVGHTSGKVVRAAWKATAQALVVSPTNLWTAERQSMVVNVSLAQAPAADVTVTVARSAGDTDVTVAGGATLTFTPANWNVPQTATIAAGADADNTADQATISVSATGLTTETVTVHVRDEALPATNDGGSDDGGGSDGGADTGGDARPDAGVDMITGPDAPEDTAVPTDGPSPDAPVLRDSLIDDGVFGDAPFDAPPVVVDAAADAAPGPDAGAPDAAVLADAAEPDAAIADMRVADAPRKLDFAPLPMGGAGGGSGGAGGANNTGDTSGGGCSCRVGAGGEAPGGALLVAGVLGVLLGRRRRRG